MKTLLTPGYARAQESRTAAAPGSSVKSRFFRAKPLTRSVVALQATSAGGAYCNGGFIITPKGVILVDTFAKRQAARDALRIIGFHTPLPVLHVVYTHHHFDHVGGSRVFPRKTRIVSHENVGPHLARYNPVKARTPDVTFKHGLNLVSGPNPVYLLHMGRGHSNADTFVYLPRDQILFTGDMVVHKDAGFFGQARVLEWIWTLKLLSILPIKKVVPGHGPIGGRKVLTDFIGYLEFMYRSVRSLKRKGLSDAAVRRRFRLIKPYSDWANARSRTRTAVKRILRELRLLRRRPIRKAPTPQTPTGRGGRR